MLITHLQTTRIDFYFEDMLATNHLHTGGNM